MAGDTRQDINEPGLGSTSLRRAVAIGLYMKAARSPPRSEPANSQALRPMAGGRLDRSTALFERQMRPSVRKRLNEAQRFSM
jgi:hypothetical protein